MKPLLGSRFTLNVSSYFLRKIKNVVCWILQGSLRVNWQISGQMADGHHAKTQNIKWPSLARSICVMKLTKHEHAYAKYAPNSWFHEWHFFSDESLWYFLIWSSNIGFRCLIECLTEGVQTSTQKPVLKLEIMYNPSV